MSTRRDVLASLGAAGGGLFLRGLSGFAPPSASLGRRFDDPLRSVDAGAVRVSPGIWIPIKIPGVHVEFLHLRMADGVKLAVTLLMPEAASRSAPVPGTLNTDPYRKDDYPDGYSDGYHSEILRAGYAVLIMDVRGTGGSEGIPEDEYSPQEHADSIAVIDWLSKQPWCTGSIGMFGGSYSAINTMWVAAQNPPALKAIVTGCGSDNRYTDDVHYKGGSMLLLENVWSIAMILANTMPGAPNYDTRSKAMADRFNTPPWYMRWVREQTDGPYWRQGSLAPDYGRLKIPTLLVGGYLDNYTDFVPQVMRHAPAITKGVTGWWDHGLMQPGPAIGGRGFGPMVRWFDQWLKGVDTGIMREPRVSCYMPRWHRQGYYYTKDAPGEWRHFDAWPETVFKPDLRLFLRPEPEVAPEAVERMPVPHGRGGRLADVAGNASALKLRYVPSRGVTVKGWAPTGDDSFYGMETQEDDAYGLSFETAPLPETVEILGFARARLFVAATAPVATWVVRISDVAPDGTAYHVARGYKNGTHRNSDTDPEPLVPGAVYELAVQLNVVGWTFEPGHRIRVVVTNADWPHLWPSPHPMVTTLYAGADRASHIDLPVLRVRGRVDGSVLGTNPDSPSSKHTPVNHVVTRDYLAGEATVRVISEYFGEATQVEARARLKDADPASASLEMDAVHRIAVGRRKLENRAVGALESTKDEFVFDVTCTLSENGRTVHSRRWEQRTPRRGV